MLRASAQSSGIDVDLQSVKGRAASNKNSNQNADDPTGIGGGEALLAFTEAVLHCDLADIKKSRERVAALLSPAHAVEAAAVMGAFMCNTRIADATGIPLDKPTAPVRLAVASELGLTHFATQ